MNQVIKTKRTMSAIGLAVVVVASLLMVTTFNKPHETYISEAALPDYPIDHLAKISKYAIVGKVIKITPAQLIVDEKHGEKTVLTDVTVHVEKDIFQNYDGKEITVRVFGGTMDNVTLISDASPQFSVGERVLLLISDKEPESIFGDNYYVAGWALGKYEISNNKAHNSYKGTDVSEIELVDKINKAKLVNVDQ